MKFVVFVEGHTEEKAVPSFLKRWLDSRLGQRVGIKVVRFEGWRDYENGIAKKAALHLSGKSGQGVIAAIGLLDLYGPEFYPPDKKSAEERLSWAKKHLEKKVGNAHFTQHFAVHELEAWLLSVPAIFPAEVRRGFSVKCEKPETINFDEPPAKLLDRLYKEKSKRSYRKIIDGVNLFAGLDPALAREKCPHLKALLDEMLQKAKEAGL